MPFFRNSVRSLWGTALALSCLMLIGGLAISITSSDPARGAVTSSIGNGPSASSARGSAASNPLDRRWGVYRGVGEPSWSPYSASTGEDRELLAKIAERPKAVWFGSWIADSQIEGVVRNYVANATGGDPDVLVQMAIFRMVPWEGNDLVCDRLPTADEQASYRAWMAGFARGVGEAHAAIIMQPDGPFALCAKHHSKLPSHMISAATATLAALPNTSIYIDAGASDWNRDDARQAVKMLIPAGVKYARGFAFNSSHYASTAEEVTYGAKVVKALAKRGLPGKHFVINTSSNGRGFPGFTYKGPNYDNARVCASLASRHCVTLGIPPTTDVANAAWGLGAKVSHKAAAFVDGYLWFGRPWLFEQAAPFDLGRALQLARTTPYAGPTLPPRPVTTPLPSDVPTDSPSPTGSPNQ